MATKTWQNIRFSEKGNPDGCSYALFGSCCAARDSKHFRHSLRLRLALVSHNWILDLFFLFRILRPREKKETEKYHIPESDVIVQSKTDESYKEKNPETAALNY